MHKLKKNESRNNLDWICYTCIYIHSDRFISHCRFEEVWLWLVLVGQEQVQGWWVELATHE